jgi:hypothetical protein
MSVTELKLNLSQGNGPSSAVAAVAIGWYTDDAEKLSASKIFHGGKQAVKEQIAALVERLLAEIPDE